MISSKKCTITFFSVIKSWPFLHSKVHKTNGKISSSILLKTIQDKTSRYFLYNKKRLSICSWYRSKKVPKNPSKCLDPKLKLWIEKTLDPDQIHQVIKTVQTAAFYQEE